MVKDYQLSTLDFFHSFDFVIEAEKRIELFDTHIIQSLMRAFEFVAQYFWDVIMPGNA